MTTLPTLERHAVILELVKELRNAGSWCGETHIQKTAYYLEAFCRVPLNLGFILYKHGPFSFGLRDQLTVMEAHGMVGVEVKNSDYGPSFFPKREFPNLAAPWAACIAAVAQRLGPCDVRTLEGLATALYVAHELGRDSSQDVRARRLTELKPHIALEAAGKFVRDNDEFCRSLEAAPRFLASR